MRLIRHPGDHPDKLLRIETPGCAIHVTVGVHDVQGHDMVTVEISPAEPDDSGVAWKLDGSSSVRVIATGPATDPGRSAR